jgi:CRISPR-associated protein Csm4
MLFNDEIDPLCHAPGFRVSSAFPYIGENRFYPVPIGSLDDVMSDKKEDIKVWRKLRYIPENIFIHYLAQGKFDPEDIEILKSQNIDSLRSKYGQEFERPRVTVCRMLSSVLDGGYFHSRDFVFYDDSGYYFLADFDDQQIQDKFDAALRLLGDNGIGADRNIGRGQFSFKKQKIDAFDNPSYRQKAILLSLYFPSETEVREGVLDESSYAIVPRYGYVATFGIGNVRRKKINMLAEGSVISGKGRGYGMIKKVVDKDELQGLLFDVYRYGIGFFVAIKGSENEH